MDHSGCLMSESTRQLSHYAVTTEETSVARGESLRRRCFSLSQLKVEDVAITHEELFVLVFTMRYVRDLWAAYIPLSNSEQGAWRKGLQHGGADGGILLTDELNRVENRGLEEIGARTREW